MFDIRTLSGWARRLLAVALLLAAAGAFSLLVHVRTARAQTTCYAPWPTINLVQVAEEISQPLGIVSAGDGSGRLFIVSKTGTVHVLKNGAVLPTPFLDLSDRVSTCNECGLLSIAFPENYAQGGYFFVSYTANTNRVPAALPGEPNPTPGNDNVIARYRVSANPDVATAVPVADEEVVLEINQPYQNHNGGLILFGPDGYLYAGIGDGGRGGDPHNNAQNLNSLLGKMLRIGVSGTGTYTTPPDNPFAGATPGRDEIWDYGLRNPWRFSFDAQNGDLWIADVGQGLWEEVNLEPAGAPGGRNYGWRMLEGTHCYPPTVEECATAGLTMPVWEYGHSEGSSITGGFVYRGAASPAMRATYLFSDWGSGTIWGLRPTPGGWTSQALATSGYAVAAFGEDADGELYVADIAGGGVYRLDASATGPGICQYLPQVNRPSVE